MTDQLSKAELDDLALAKEEKIVITGEKREFVEKWVKTCVGITKEDKLCKTAPRKALFTCYKPDHHQYEPVLVTEDATDYIVNEKMKEILPLLKQRRSEEDEEPTGPSLVMTQHIMQHFRCQTLINLVLMIVRTLLPSLRLFR